MKRILIGIAIGTVFIAMGLAAAATEQVDDTLAQAYTAVQQGKQAEATQLFSDAGKHAQHAQDWQGALDAGYGLAALNQTEKAHALFSEASQIAKKKNSSGGLIAAGYALASLPKDRNAAADAEAVLDEALSQVEKEGISEGAKTIAKAYQILGRAEKVQKAEALAQQLAQAGGEELSGKPTPPPGWSPVGESIKGPKEVPVEVQRLNRESADRDIAHKMDYIKHSEKLAEQEKERRTRLAEAYLYGAPYYYTYAGTLIPANLTSWAAFQLARFTRRGAIFVRVERYTFF